MKKIIVSGFQGIRKNFNRISDKTWKQTYILLLLFNIHVGTDPVSELFVKKLIEKRRKT